MHGRHPHRRHAAPRATDARGFTMVELMITLTVLAAVMVVLMTIIYAAARSKTTTVNRVESAQAARIAVDMIARDLRSAGYGADLDYLAAPQPPISYIDSLEVLINENLNPWPDSPPGGLLGAPQAYDPAGNPRPFPLDGTAWTPPIKYHRGAETIRWTLDVNNDGKTDSLDWTAPNGLDAQRTPNRNDYVLVRQVYGDSVGNIAGNNWGNTERVALIQRPTSGTAPPMFRVYLEGSATPWDWSSGPVPAAQLNKIERVVINVQAGSARPDFKGDFATTNLSTEVSSMRNVPNFGANLYSISGYIFNDQNKNGSRDAGEPGLEGATARLSNGFATLSDAAGLFVFQVPAGTYTLRHTPPSGYGVFTSPDSFVVTLPPSATRSFADTARAGGWIYSFVFNDIDGDGVYNSGTEAPLTGLKVEVTPGPDVGYTKNDGTVTNFAGVGAFTVTVTPPDSFTATTPNPVSGVMTNGGSASYSFGFRNVAKGTVQGTVFVDHDRDGNIDLNDKGIAEMWVGVTPDAGSTIVAWQYTDGSGNYSLDVPAISAPAAPYYVMTIVKSGYSPTTATSLGPFYINGGQTLTGYNFGEIGYQVITLNASRVLSLASKDVVERDWDSKLGEATAHKDVDLILGADASGSDQISVWFNQYDQTPVFDANPTYKRTAQSSVLAMALDTLDNTASARYRPDVATGTRNATGGNFFVWLNQNSKNNEGYLPTSADLSYRTLDMGDVQSILAFDCAGGTMPDLIVGTKSPTANQGTIEVWQNNGASNVAFARQEAYPPYGSIPGNALGEVQAMALADFDRDGRKDLVIGTQNGTYRGQLLFFRFVSKLNGSRFVYQCGYDLPAEAVTSIACFDIDADSLVDVIVGTQQNSTSGHLQQWGNKYLSGTWSFAKDREVNAPGIVLSLVTADFGGLNRNDLAVGFRSDMGNYNGGLRIYFCDTNKIPATGSDPSAGLITNMVPALTANNFDYGLYPTPPPSPYLTDLAAGIKISPTTGALIVFLR